MSNTESEPRHFSLNDINKLSREIEFGVNETIPVVRAINSEGEVVGLPVYHRPSGEVALFNSNFLFQIYLTMDLTSHNISLIMFLTIF